MKEPGSIQARKMDTVKGRNAEKEEKEVMVSEHNPSSSVAEAGYGLP